jgi:fucose 4-O-acetylase-like acetyltransferase
MQAMAPDAERIVFLDNTRFLMVFCVVLTHTAAAYTHSLSWWYVRNAHTSLFFDVLGFVFDIFQMPVLFFIAGYFALPSLHGRGVGGFLTAKFKRLGILFVLLAIFLAPVMPYIRYRVRTSDAIGFRGHWLAQMKTIVPFTFEHASGLRLQSLIDGLIIETTSF